MKFLCLLLYFLAPGPLHAKHDETPKHLGEYYEYNVEGSPKHQAHKRIRHRIRHVVKAPFALSYKGIRLSHKMLKKTSRIIENYLRGSMSTREQAKLSQTLTSWETALSKKPRGAHHSHPGIGYIPSEAWRLLKYSLYISGFAFPRAVKRTLKDMVYGTCGGLPRDESWTD